MKEVKLAAFDMDGTILEEDSSWAALHRHFNTTQSENESLKLYRVGKIDYKEFMRRDIISWPKGLTISDVENILSKYKIRDDAPDTIQKLKSKGIQVALITAGIDVLAKKVAQHLGIELWIANGLQFDGRGRLTGEGIGKVDPLRKDIPFRKLVKDLGINSDETIAVGDTIYDLAFLKAAGMGFFLSKENIALDPSVIKIQNLSDIFTYVD